MFRNCCARSRFAGMRVVLLAIGLLAAEGAAAADDAAWALFKKPGEIGPPSASVRRNENWTMLDVHKRAASAMNFASMESKPFTSFPASTAARLKLQNLRGLVRSANCLHSIKSS